MATNRIAIDCRWFPADIPCEFAISGDEEQVLNLAVQHAVESHGYRDTPALREQLRSILRNESERAALPGTASEAQ
jgi:predicted small metal-binding protein